MPARPHNVFTSRHPQKDTTNEIDNCLDRRTDDAARNDFLVDPLCDAIAAFERRKVAPRAEAALMTIANKSPVIAAATESTGHKERSSEAETARALLSRLGLASA